MCGTQMKSLHPLGDHSSKVTLVPSAPYPGTHEDMDTAIPDKGQADEPSSILKECQETIPEVWEGSGLMYIEPITMMKPLLLIW